MAGKLLVLVLGLALTAAVLLVIRHRRLETAHAMTVVHQRMVEKERTLWTLRAEIADRCRPETIRALMPDVPDGWTTVPDPELVGRAEMPDAVAGPVAGGDGDGG